MYEINQKFRMFAVVDIIMFNTKSVTNQSNLNMCVIVIIFKTMIINRFVDHMHSEHEVKHEPEVVLAVSVNLTSENRI